MNELTIGDKIYISSKRAAEITGYAKDYIGQLCREGRVEATLVGRSWYVLETSIRAHRFGADQPEIAPAPSNPEPLPTWEPPKYMSEKVDAVPTLERKSINLIAEKPAVVQDAPSEPVIEPAATSAEDMQTAWREWFATRQQSEPVTVEDDMAKDIDHEPAAEQVEAEEPVALRRVEEDITPQRSSEVQDATYDPVPFTREIEEDVPLRRSYDMARSTAPEIRIVGASRPARVGREHRANKPGKSSLAIKAGLTAVAVLAGIVAFVGAGFADVYIRNAGIESTLIRFFAGASIID